MAEPCLACSLAEHSLSAGGVVRSVRHQARTLAMGVSVRFVGRSASVLGWAMLSTGFLLRDSEHHHSSEDAQEHAHGGVADIARSLSW